MFTLLKFYIDPMKIKISNETKSDLFNTKPTAYDSDSSEEDNIMDSDSSNDSDSSDEGMFVRYHRQALKRKKKDLGYNSLEEMAQISEIITGIKLFLKDIKAYLLNPEMELPNHSPYKKLCFCEKCVKASSGVNELKSLAVRMTVVYDYWFESGHPNKTVHKHPLLKYIHYTWIVQLAYRLLENRVELLTIPEENVQERNGVWCNCISFAGKGFPLPKLTDPKKIIAQWTPEEVNEAIVCILRARSYEEAFKLDTNVRRLLFTQYVRALKVRLAMICLFKIPYEEQLFRPEWFKGDKVLNKRFEVEITKENIAAKRVKDYTDNEDAELKKLKEEDPEDERFQKFKTVVSNDERLENVLQMNKYGAEIDRIQQRMEILDLRIVELKEDTGTYGEYEEDLAELNKFKEEYDALYKYKEKIFKEQGAHFKKEKKKRDKLFKNSIKMKKKAQKANATDEVTIHWIKENMLSADALSIIQLSNPQFTHKINNVSPEFKKMKTMLLETITKAAISTGNNSICDMAHDFIFKRFFCNSYERECFRLKYTDLASFNIMEVTNYTRNELVRFDEFPKTIEGLIDPKSEFRNKGLCCLFYWWLGQIYQSIDVARTFFMFEVEEHYCLLDRPNIPHPVIGIVAADFITLEGPEWSTKDNWLNATWYNYDFLDCATQWLINYAESQKHNVEESEEKWKLYDRIENKHINIKYTPLYDIYYDCFPSKVDT